MDKIPLLVIVGPTASGKTALSIECAIALDGEIVSADSMQIYKGMSIATAKPTVSERKNIPHYMIDFLDADKQYSVADYVSEAKEKLICIHNIGKLPILVGGTGLYVDSLVNNIKFIDVDTDLNLRAELSEKIDVIGSEKMLEELAEFDPNTAKRLHPSNKKRIIRAFEVYKLTGRTMTELEADSKSEASPFEPIFIGISFKDREILYKRINKRVDIMLENGLVEEAKNYYNLSSNSTASQAIGYKELKPYFEGEISLDAAIENLKLSTRHYAKRQLTWFRKNEEIKWFYFDEYESSEDFVFDVIQYVKKVLR